MRVGLRFLLIGALLSVPATAQGSDPLNGMWRLNLEKSVYSPASSAPKQFVMRCQVTGNRIDVVVDVIDAQGQMRHTEYTAPLDGTIVAQRSTLDGGRYPDQDSVSWKKIDDYTYDMTTWLKGEAMATVRMVIARDGRTRTSTVTSKSPSARTTKTLQVFEKEE